MNYPYNPLQGGGFVPMEPYPFQPPFYGYSGFYPNWYSAQPNIPQLMNGQQQVNPYGFLNQGTPVNYNPAFNDNNGGLGTQNYNQPSQSLQMNPGQQQVALPSVAPPMQQNHVNNATNLITTSTFETGSLLMAKYATDSMLSVIARVGPTVNFSFKVEASKDKFDFSYNQNQSN